MSFLKTIKSVVGGNFGTVADVGSLGDVTGYIDTGSYTLNALISGSIYGGIPSNKITGFGGDPSTGKTFFGLNAVEGFIKAHPENEVVIFDSESAITTDQLVNRGIDLERIAIQPAETIEGFRTDAKKILDAYGESRKDFKEPRLMIVLDSLGNLSTKKEIGDITEGSDKRDMTKPQLVKGAFRVLTIACGKLNVPMIVTNHVYSSIGAYIPTKTMSGGTGLIYAASSILFFSKSKEKEGEVVSGSIIKVKTEKSRITREGQKISTLLNFDRGLDRYYGLFELAEEAGLFVKEGRKYKLPDGRSMFESHIREQITKDPTALYTPEILAKIDTHCKATFCYGIDELPPEVPAELAEEESEV